MKEFDAAQPFNKTHVEKKWIDHLIFEVNQTLSWVIEQSGTHIRNTWMEQNQRFQFQTIIDGKCINYLSTVVWKQSRQHKVLLLLLFPFSELNSKINILCENVNTLILFCLPRKKSLNLQVEIILEIISIIITLHSWIGFNCSIFFLNPAHVRFPWLVAFLKLTQFSNLIFFPIQFGLFWFCSGIKLSKKLVWYCLMAKLFCSEEFDGNFVLCNTLYTRSIHLLQ